MPESGSTEIAARIGECVAPSCAHAVIVHSAVAINASGPGPSVYRTVDREHPTLIIDEADDLFYRKSDLRAIVNAGWTLAEVQIALELAVGEVTGLAGFEQKRVVRTGTVARVDNRNWEISDPAIIRRLSQSRAIALDMELAAIAANGFRFRVPYGTLLCVSDKPLHGEIKLAGMAGEFYRQRVGQHLEIGLRALEKLKAQDWERLHSRKLRSFAEVAFQ